MNKIKFALLAVIQIGLLFCTRSEAAVTEIKDAACLECHSDKTLTKSNKAGKETSLFANPEVIKASVHKGRSCVACHAGMTAEHPNDGKPVKPVDCRRCHEMQSSTYDKSVHGLAGKEGSGVAPGCVDCHGGHNVLPHTLPSSPLHFSNLTKTCGGCHEQESQDVQASVHGQAAAEGEREAATCIDCHNEHGIETLKQASSYKISMEICSKCHASLRINRKFNMPGDRVSTFLGSYHGLTAQGGASGTANCASCHGYHKILRAWDPDSSINKSHLVATCGRCHPGANENFAFSRVHTDDATGSDTGAVASRWVRRVYLALIFIVVGSLALHNILAWLRCAIEARRARGALVTRMALGYRIQHFILLSSFILLALTGFALKYPDSWLAWVFGADENIRRWLHRDAGVVLMGLGLFHVCQVLATRDGRQLARDFMPGWQDLKDMITNLLYYTGRGTGRAKFGRFGYPEKLEYWAVIWGTVIMGVTGLMIWLKMDVTQVLPRWVVEVAVTVHYYEAILACLAIVVWHFYHVIFAPDIYPMNWAWWDGKVPKHWQEAEHPLDKAPAGPEKPESKPAKEN